MRLGARGAPVTRAFRASWDWGGDDAKAFLRYLALATFVSFGVLLAWWLQSFPPNVAVPWPTWAAMVKLQQEQQFELADVNWNVGLVVGGYEPPPVGVVDPYLTQHNWAYFPLTLYVGQALAAVTGNVWWAMHALSLLSVAAFMTLVRSERERVRREGGADDTWTMRHELLLLFFVLPLGWPCINFIVLPMVCQFALFFAYLRLGRHRKPIGPGALATIGTLALLVGFSRPQGLPVLAVLAAGALLHFRSESLSARVRLAAVLLAPILLVFLFFQVKTGSPLSFYFVQKAWGRKFSMPWVPFVESAVSDGPFASAYSSFAVVVFRTVATFAAIGFACMRWASDLWTSPERRDELRLEGWVLAATLLLGVLPFTTGTLLGAHRYLCFAMYPVVAAPQRNLGSRLGPLLVLALVFIRVGELAFFLRHSFFAIW